MAAFNPNGSLQEALERPRAPVRERKVFGQPIVAHQHVAFRLAELSAQLDVVRHHAYACAQAYMAGEDTTRFATIAKLAVGRLAREVADTCLQFHGGIGYMEEHWTARFFRDTRLL